jgi:hypothetical protein
MEFFSQLHEDDPIEVLLQRAEDEVDPGEVARYYRLAARLLDRDSQPNAAKYYRAIAAHYATEPPQTHADAPPSDNQVE